MNYSVPVRLEAFELSRVDNDLSGSSIKECYDIFLGLDLRHVQVDYYVNILLEEVQDQIRIVDCRRKVGASQGLQLTLREAIF